MAKRGIAVAGMVLGAVALAATSLWYALSPHGGKDKADAQPMAPPELSAEVAKRLFSERGRVISPSETRPALAGEAYAFLVGGAKGGSDAAPFFRDLFSGLPLQVGAAVLSAAVRLDDGRALPPVPVAVMAGAPDFRAVFLPGEAGLRLTPLFSVNGTAKATISLSLAYVPSGEATLLGGLVGEAESLFSFLSAEPAPLWTSPGGAQLRAQAFADRLAALGAKTIDGVMIFDILLKDAADSRTRSVELVDTAGQPQATLTFQLGSHAPLFAAGSVAQPTLAALAVLPADGGRSVGDYLASRAGTDLGSLLVAAPEGLAAACTALHGRLLESAGLGSQDAAVVLKGAAQVRSLFAGGGDAAACPGPENLALVEKAGFPAAAAQAAKPSAQAEAARQRRFDAAVDQMAKVMNPSVPAAVKDSLSSRFAPGVALFDATGFWLTGASTRIVQAGATTILPATDAAEAVQILGFLPIARLGCPAPAEDKAATRRGLLVQLGPEPELWHLDLAFDESDRVAGVSLAPATQADYCRAMAARRGACPFAGKGPWRDIQPGKC